MAQKYQLIIQIFDFIDFKEKFENEKYLLKQKIEAFGKTYNIQLINIEESEDLFNIVKGIYETQSKK